MTDLILIIVFGAMLFAGGFIIRAIDSFIARYVIKCTGADKEADECERSGAAESE